LVKSAQAQDRAATPDDLRFMCMALDVARRADFLFGAVIVRDGRASRGRLVRAARFTRKAQAVRKAPRDRSPRRAG